MADASRWWAHRLGRTAAATTSGTQNQPNYGVAFDVATAPLTDSQYEEAVNAIQTQSEEEALRASVLQWGHALFQGFRGITGKPRKKSFMQRVKGGIGSAFGAVGDVVGGAGDFLRDASEFQDRFIFGEEYAERQADRREQVRGAIGEGIQAYETHVSEPVERGISTPLQTGNIVDEEGFLSNLGMWLDGSTWEEAWERTENASFGRSLADVFADPEVREAGYEEGFDEAGTPLDANYRELREDDVAYNLISGSVDFLQEMFLDPLVFAGKAATLTRAAIKGDVDRLGRRNAAQMRRVVSAPDSALPNLKVKPWDVVGQRSLALREQVGSLRDRMRSGELDATRLVENVQAFREDPTAAAFFAQLSNARKWDAENLRYTDEFDDDVFYHGVGAMLGSHEAYDKLRVAFGDQGRQIADYVDALRTKDIPSVGDELKLAQYRYEEALTDPSVSGFQAYERALNAQKDIATLRREGEMLGSRLEEYESYGRFINSVDDRVAQSTLSMVPRPGRSIADSMIDTASHTYRSSDTGAVSTYVKYPIAAFRERPGVMDLSRNIHTEGNRYIGEALAIGGKKGLDNWSAVSGDVPFDAVRSSLLNRAAAATTDVERRRIGGEIEMQGIELVVRKHGLSGDQARAIAAQYRHRRQGLFRDIERQAAENRAYSAADAPLTYRWNNNGVMEEIELPLTLTQLQNYFVPMDLKALDQLLSQHGESIKVLSRARDGADQLASYFEAWWKPLVLLRGGYIVRNVSDEMIRATAAANTLLTVADAGKAAVVGLGNLPIRAVNRLGSGFNRAARRKYVKRQERNPLTVRASDGAVYEPDVARLVTIQKQLSPIERWNQKRLAAQSTGAREPKAPALVGRLQAGLDSGESFALDVATGRKTKSVDAVTPLEFGDEAVVTDVAGITRWADDHAELLSHPDGVLLVSKVDDGFRVAVGRRGARYARQLPKVEQIGSKPSTVTGIHGATVEATGAFQRGFGEVYRPVASSAPFHRAMTSSYERNLSHLRAQVAQGSHSTIGETNHAGTWLKAINDKLRPDPAVRARLDGKELESWVKTSEGRAHAERIVWRSAEPYVWQTELDNHLNALLPTERLRAKVRDGEDITELELQQIIDNRRDVAPKAIDTNAVDMSTGQGIAESIGRVKDTLYKWIATIPTDTLVRHPFFNRMYKSRLQAQIDTLNAGAVVDQKAQQVMERQAREYALRQTRRYMFSLDGQTSLQHTLRHVTAFMPAWQETLVRYARIFTERPEQFVRLYTNGWTQLDKVNFVDFVDENGLGKDDPDHGELDHIRMPFLGDAMRWFDKVLPGDQEAAAEVFETFNISKEGLNTVLQGNPWWIPGVSPLVQVPASYMLKDHPDLANDNAFSAFMYKYLMPTGPQSVKDVIFPAAWMQQVRRQIEGADDPIFNRQMLTRVHQQDMHDWIAGGRVGDAPTELESLEKAQAAQAFMIAARFMAPASFQPEVKGQFFIDMANRIQTEHGYGEEAYQKYLDEYGEDAYVWWQSTTQSHTSIPATSQGFKQSERYRDQIEKYPELGLALVGLGTETDEFNYSVYQHQTETPISGVDGRMQREPRGPVDTVAAAEEREGWRRWNTWNTKIDSELSARGLHSTQQSGAEDLALIKSQISDQLQAELPGWAEAYTSFDTDKSYGIVRAMQDLVDNDQSPNRPDWHGVEEYLEIHRKIGAELDARSMVGGSRDITAQDNADLHLAYGVLVGELKQKNLMFGEFFDRFLSRHQLTLGSGRV